MKIRRLAKDAETTRFSLAPQPFRTVPWREGARWSRWTLGEPIVLELMGAEPPLRVLTPDPEMAMARVQAIMTPR